MGDTQCYRKVVMKFYVLHHCKSKMLNESEATEFLEFFAPYVMCNDLFKNGCQSGLEVNEVDWEVFSE